MNHRGVEGLPLKYLILALVASIIIGISLQMMSFLRENVGNNTEIVGNSLTAKILESTIGDSSVSGFRYVGVSDWSLPSDSGDLSLSIFNKYSSPINITNIFASFDDNDAVRSSDFVLQPGEGSVKLIFGLNAQVNSGDSVRVFVNVSISSLGDDIGTLIGKAS